MTEVLHVSFQGINIIPTILLLLVVIYWVTVILGALDLGFLDFDMDPDFESDVEIEVDADIDSDVNAASSLDKILSFLNLGRVPFMVFLTCFALPLWTCSILSNHYLGITHTGIAIALLIPFSVPSALCAKILTTPFAGMFEKMERDEISNIKLVGKICKAKWEINSAKFTQASINHEGSVFLISVKTVDDQVVLKGDNALVIKYIKKENLFLVEPYQI